jgi:hypothetical protein
MSDNKVAVSPSKVPWDRSNLLSPATMDNQKQALILRSAAAPKSHTLHFFSGYKASALDAYDVKI